MRVAVLTPLPPAKTGVAHYASLLLPALAEKHDVRAFDSLDGYRREDFDEVVYQLGNNPHHAWIYAEAMREPGVVVLHDLVLHHLIVEMTLARGDADGYIAALEANHGAAGAAWARGRAAGLHSEMGNFLLPASVEVAQRSTAVIVHNEYAKNRLLSFGVETPIHVVPHPYMPETRTFDRDAIRARHRIAPDVRVIGFFGFLTGPKRAEPVLEAFRIARETNPKLVLLVVGEPAPNVDLHKLAVAGVIATGYVADDEFPAYYAAADRFVNLRYPSAGETSGTLIRALDAGKPVAVSDYAQFAEMPGWKVPLGAGEVASLVEFFLRDFEAVSYRDWLREHLSLELTVAGYGEALGARRHGRRYQSGGFATALLQLFPTLELTHGAIDDGNIVFGVRNLGSLIRTRTYDQPEYRLIAKVFDGEREIQNRWLSLPRDLERGEEAELSFPLIGAHDSVTLRLYHALQDIPMLEPEAWDSAEVKRVR